MGLAVLSGLFAEFIREMERELFPGFWVLATPGAIFGALVVTGAFALIMATAFKLRRAARVLWVGGALLAIAEACFLLVCVVLPLHRFVERMGG